MFATVKNEKELAKAAKYAKLQIEAWEKTLALRISMQKSLDLVNHLPVIDRNEVLQLVDEENRDDLQEEYGKLSTSLQNVSNSLVEMLEQQAKVHDIDIPSDDSIDDKDEETKLWNRIQNVNDALETSFWFPTLNKWHTRIHFGAEKNKSKLKVFNQNISDQIDQAMHDDRRVIERACVAAQESSRMDVKHFAVTLFPSSSSSSKQKTTIFAQTEEQRNDEASDLFRLYEQFGIYCEEQHGASKAFHDLDEENEQENLIAAAAAVAEEEHMTEVEVRKRKRVFDTEVYDDRAFYSLLLKTFITANQSNNANNSLGLNAEDLAQLKQYKRAKTSNKHIDRKASKGRRIRYTVHQKLQHFMFPIPKAVFVASSVSGGVSAMVDSDRLLASLFQ